MAGMAANVSSLNTVFTYDIWQDWIRKDHEDDYYLRVGRLITVLGTLMAIGTAFIAAGFSNIMDYIQTLFSFFNVPLFAVFIMGLFWKRMTGTAGWAGLAAGITGAVVVFILNRAGVFSFSGQGSSFVGGGTGFALALIVGYVVSLRTESKPEEDLVGLVWSLTPKQTRQVPRQAGWSRSPALLGGGVLVLAAACYILVSV